VGKSVFKYFHNHGWFGGKLKAYSDGFWQAKYEDGDREDMDLQDTKFTLVHPVTTPHPVTRTDKCRVATKQMTKKPLFGVMRERGRGWGVRALETITNATGDWMFIFETAPFPPSLLLDPRTLSEARLRHLELLHASKSEAVDCERARHVLGFGRAAPLYINAPDPGVEATVRLRWCAAKRTVRVHLRPKTVVRKGYFLRATYGQGAAGRLNRNRRLTSQYQVLPLPQSHRAASPRFSRGKVAKGVFAAMDLLPGSLLDFYHGLRRKSELPADLERRDLVDGGEEGFVIDPMQGEVANEGMRYINSCEGLGAGARPNAELVLTVALEVEVWIKKGAVVRKGDEILLDYGDMFRVDEVHGQVI
jgi:hypothetical protein